MKKLLKAISNQFDIIVDDFNNGRIIWATIQLIMISALGAGTILGVRRTARNSHKKHTQNA